MGRHHPGFGPPVGPSTEPLEIFPSVVLTPKELREWARVAEDRGSNVVARVTKGAVTIGLTHN